MMNKGSTVGFARCAECLWADQGPQYQVTMSHAVCVTEFAQCAALLLTDPEYPYQSRYLLQYVDRSLYGVSNVCGQIRDLRTSDEISFTICK